MTCRDVLDGDKKWWGNAALAAKAAHEVGYSYFSWGGRIYTVHFADGSYSDTGLLVENLK